MVSKRFVLLGIFALSVGAAFVGTLWNLQGETLQGQLAQGTSQVVDDGDAGFKTTGNGWQTFQHNLGYKGDISSPTSPTDLTLGATWTFSNVSAGQYKFFVTFKAYSLLTNQAPYVIRDGVTTIGSTTVNQKVDPSGNTFDGKDWALLGTYTVKGPTVSINLFRPPSLTANGVIADAARIERMGGSAAAPTVAPGNSLLLRGAASSAFKSVITLGTAQMSSAKIAVLPSIGTQGTAVSSAKQVINGSTTPTSPSVALGTSYMPPNNQNCPLGAQICSCSINMSQSECGEFACGREGKVYDAQRHMCACRPGMGCSDGSTNNPYCDCQPLTCPQGYHLDDKTFTCLPDSVCGDGYLEYANIPQERCELDGNQGCPPERTCSTCQSCLVCGDTLLTNNEECETDYTCASGKSCGPSCSCVDSSTPLTANLTSNIPSTSRLATTTVVSSDITRVTWSLPVRSGETYDIYVAVHRTCNYPSSGSCSTPACPTNFWKVFNGSQEVRPLLVAFGTPLCYSWPDDAGKLTTWIRLAQVPASSSTIRVQHEPTPLPINGNPMDPARRFAIADSVRLVKVVTGTEVPAPLGVTLIDDGDQGFSVSGTYQTSFAPPTLPWYTIDQGQLSFGDDFTSPSYYPSWAFTVTPNATYRVLVSYRASGNTTYNRTYAITDGWNNSLPPAPRGQELGPVTFDGKNPPDGGWYRGVQWRDIGSFTVRSSRLTITGKTGFFGTDAVRIEQTSGPVSSQSSIASSASSAAACAQEGDVVTETNMRLCCSGLVSRANITPSSSGICPSVSLSTICIRCGNGTCGTGENFCNCLADCPRPSSSSAASSRSASDSSAATCTSTPWNACATGFTCLASCSGSSCWTASHIDCGPGQQAEYSGTCGNTTCSAQCGRCVGGSSSSSRSSSTATQPSITVTLPNGGESCTIGQDCVLRWTSSGLGDRSIAIDIVNYTTNNNGSPIQIVNAAWGVKASDGQYAWRIVSNITPGTKFKIRVYDEDISISPVRVTQDYSDNFFTIVAQSSSSSVSSASSVTTCSASPWTACPTGFSCLASCSNGQCGRYAMDCMPNTTPQYEGTCGNTTCSAPCGRCVGGSSSSSQSSNSSSAATCGNGQADTGEQCDGPNNPCPSGQICTAACLCATLPPSQIQWQTVGDSYLVSTITDYALFGHGSYLYLVGGMDFWGGVKSELRSADGLQWTSVASLPQPLANAASVQVEGNAMLLGGLANKDSVVQWAFATPNLLSAGFTSNPAYGLPVPRYDAAALRVGSKTYLLGGFYKSTPLGGSLLGSLLGALLGQTAVPYPSKEVYVHNGTSWSRLQPDLPFNVAKNDAFTLGSKLFILDQSKPRKVYVSENGTVWAQVSTLPAATSDMPLLKPTLHKGAIWILGKSGTFAGSAVATTDGISWQTVTGVFPSTLNDFKPDSVVSFQNELWVLGNVSDYYIGGSGRNGKVLKTGAGGGPVCGNGHIEGEACDDGNTANGDGCDQNCHIEQGWLCGGTTGQQSVCDRWNSCASGYECNASPYFGNDNAWHCGFTGAIPQGCHIERNGVGCGNVDWCGTAQCQKTVCDGSSSSAAGQLDVSIVKNGPETAVRGGDVVYQFTVSNSGQAALQNVLVVDTYPSPLVFRSADDSSCVQSTMAGTPVISCNIASLPLAGIKRISLKFDAPTVANCSPVTITNRVEARATGDNNAANNTSTVTTLLTCPPASSSSSSLACTQEGQTHAVVPGASCCQGLTDVSPVVLPSSGICPPPPVGSSRCTKCGDGICGTGENKCNCPADCPVACRVYEPPLCSNGILVPQLGPDANGCRLPPVCCEGANNPTAQCTMDLQCANGSCVISSCTCQ